MQETTDIPTGDLDSLVTEDFSTNLECSEDDILKTAIESLSGSAGSIGQLQKTSPKNQRNFASILGGQQKSPERNFASLLDPKSNGSPRSFATLLGRQKSPNRLKERNFSSLLPSRNVPSGNSNSKVTLVLKPKVSTVFENRRKSLIQHCKRSELRLHFEWTKIHLKMPKMAQIGECLKT